MPSEGRHSWHSRAHPPPLSSPGRVTLSDNRLRAGRTDRGMDLAARNKETAKIHSCNSSLSSLFRHKRRMEQVELSGRITGRLGYTRRPEPTPSEGRQRWHNDTLSSPQPPPPALFLRDDCGPARAVGDGHRRLYRRYGPQDLPRDCGPDGAAGGLRAELTAACGRHDHATFGSGKRVSVRRPRRQTAC